MHKGLLGMRFLQLRRLQIPMWFTQTYIIIQLYEGSTNQPLNWSFSLELEALLLVTLSFDSFVIATIDPLTGSVAINQGFTTITGQRPDFKY